MKTLYLAFGLAFLVFHAQPSPAFIENPEDSEDSERNAYEPDEKGLLTTSRVGKISCLGSWGYCLLRMYRCDTGFVMRKEFNNCPNVRTLKCCVSEEIARCQNIPKQ